MASSPLDLCGCSYQNNIDGRLCNTLAYTAFFVFCLTDVAPIP